MTKRRTWKGVPEEKRGEWRQAFSQKSMGHSVPKACPICGIKTLHRYYQVGKEVSKTINETHYIAYGSLWEWCSNCLTYEHSSSLVPDWWVDNLRVDKKHLTAEPEVLELALNASNE